MFNMVCTGGPNGDCTCDYAVQFDRDYTVGEFIEEVLEKKPGEWGNFEIVSEFRYMGLVDTCEYKKGKITKRFKSDVAGRKIKEAVANGGYTLMTYFLKVQNGEE